MAGLPGTLRATPLAVEAVQFPLGTWTAFEAQVGQLLALAKALTTDGSDCPCRSEAAPCRWAGVPGGVRACRLASELALVAPPAAELDVPVADLGERYLLALRESTPAVYLCRRVLHAGNRCWFGADGAVSPTCGRVLSAAHSLQHSR